MDRGGDFVDAPPLFEMDGNTSDCCFTDQAKGVFYPAYLEHTEGIDCCGQFERTTTPYPKYLVTDFSVKTDTQCLRCIFTKCALECCKCVLLRE